MQGTTGSEVETYFNRLGMYNARSMFRKTNGGLHRGGIQGENSVELPIATDADLSDEEIRNNNLLLFGTDKTNALLRRFGDDLPVRFQERAIRIHDRTFAGDQVTVFAVFPHPENPERYLALHGGVTEDAVTFGSHLNLLLLPDYLVYDGPRVLAWGFWDNQWKFQPEGKSP